MQYLLLCMALTSIKTVLDQWLLLMPVRSCVHWQPEATRCSPIIREITQDIYLLTSPATPILPPPFLYKYSMSVGGRNFKFQPAKAPSTWLVSNARNCVCIKSTQTLASVGIFIKKIKRTNNLTNIYSQLKHLYWYLVQPPDIFSSSLWSLVYSFHCQCPQFSFF